MSKSIQPKWVLPLISLVTFLGFLDSHLLLPIMALYASSICASTGAIGIIIGLYSIANTAANVVFGRLVDKIGYKFPLLAGLLGDSVSMVLYTICRLPVCLALVRSVHGASGGLIGPATMSATAHYSGRKKGRAMGVYGMSLAAATFVGFGVSGVLASKFGYDAVFLFGAILLLIGAVISLPLPKTEKSMAEPSLNVDKINLLKRRGLIIAYLGVFSQYFTLGSVVTLLPLYVTGLDMEAFHVGMLLATFSITSFIIQIPCGALSDRMGRVLLIVISLILCMLSLVTIPLVAVFPLLAGVMILYGTAHGTLFPSVSALIADHTAPEERGIATGIFHALITIGVAVGAPVTGLIGEIVGTERGLASTAVVPAVVLVMTVIAKRHTSVR